MHLHLQASQPVEEPSSCPVASAHNSQFSQVLLLLQGSAVDYVQQHPAEHHWQPQERAIPYDEHSLQPAEHFSAAEATSEPAEDAQVALKPCIAAWHHISCSCTLCERAHSSALLSCARMQQATPAGLWGQQVDMLLQEQCTQVTPGSLQGEGQGLSIRRATGSLQKTAWAVCRL